MVTSSPCKTQRVSLLQGDDSLSRGVFVPVFDLQAQSPHNMYYTPVQFSVCPSLSTPARELFKGREPDPVNHPSTRAPSTGLGS